MQKDDAPMFWVTLDSNESQSIGAEQLMCPPFLMGTDVRCTTLTSTHHNQNRESKQTTTVGKATHATNSP